MTFLAFKQFLSRAWLWIKQNWEIALAAIVALIILVTAVAAGRRQDFNEVTKIFENLREKQKEETAAILDAQEKEVKELEDIRKKTEKALAGVEKKYKEQSQALDRKKKKAIEKVVAENKDDPDAITSKIAKLTGFTVVVRDDD